MKILNFTLIKLTLCLITGIITAYFYSFSVKQSLVICISGLILLSGSFLISKSRFTKTIWFGLLGYLTMISVGILTVELHNQVNFNNHYTKYLQNTAVPETTFRIREILKPTLYDDKYIVDILTLNSHKVSGKTLLNIKKDSANVRPNIDDVYISKTNFTRIPRPLNPGQFNYKTYLERSYIYHQISLKNHELFTVQSGRTTILGFADAFRNHINKKLKAYEFKTDELAIINALFLGQRKDISANIYNNYADAGVFHILAVSGLHVGIILMILNFILKPIEHLNHGNIYKTIILLILLWSFAIIAGLSASVTRAVTMFSVFAVAINLKRPTNIYNTLALSMLFLLLAKPLFIFDVGFQLSYLAVLAIVTINPIINNWWSPKHRVSNFIWQTLTVTISAQIGILPLSLFYFHRFPGLFFISNLAIIPFLSFLLGFGILIIVLALLNVPSNLLNICFGSIISGLNNFIAWVASLEQFIFKNIPFNLYQMFTLYMLIIAGILFIKKKSNTSVKLVLFAIIALQIAFIFTSKNIPQHEFIVFHRSKHTLIGDTFNKKTTFYSDLDSVQLFANIKTNYMVYNDISNTCNDSLKSVYVLNNKKLLVVDSLGVYNIKSFKPDYILLRQSPKINLNRLIDSLNPKTILADGSNYKSYVKQWQQVCIKRKLPFHYTGKKGAFIISY